MHGPSNPAGQPPPAIPGRPIVHKVNNERLLQRSGQPTTVDEHIGGDRRDYNRVRIKRRDAIPMRNRKKFTNLDVDQSKKWVEKSPTTTRSRHELRFEIKIVPIERRLRRMCERRTIWSNRHDSFRRESIEQIEQRRIGRNSGLRRRQSRFTDEQDLRQIRHRRISAWSGLAGLRNTTTGFGEARQEPRRASTTT